MMILHHDPFKVQKRSSHNWERRSLKKSSQKENTKKCKRIVEILKVFQPQEMTLLSAVFLAIWGWRRWSSQHAQLEGRWRPSRTRLGQSVGAGRSWIRNCDGNTSWHLRIFTSDLSNATASQTFSLLRMPQAGLGLTWGWKVDPGKKNISEWKLAWHLQRHTPDPPTPRSHLFRCWAQPRHHGNSCKNWRVHRWLPG